MMFEFHFFFFLLIQIYVLCDDRKKPQPVKNTETVDVNGGGGGGNNGRPLQDKEPAVMSYSRLSLESEAALAAAANHHPNGGSVRHLPNGLVTFAPVQQNGHHQHHPHHVNQRNNKQHTNSRQTHPLHVSSGPSSPINNGSLNQNNNHHHSDHHNSHANNHPLIRVSNGASSTPVTVNGGAVPCYVHV